MAEKTWMLVSPVKLLESGIATLKLNVDVASQARLITLAKKLITWSRVYNLTSINKLNDVIVLHILDCLATVPVLKDNSKIMDVGCGAGFPGLVYAICGLDVLLVDSNNKKLSFVRQMAAELGLKNVQIEHARLENLKVSPLVNAISARAFSSLTKLVQLTEDNLSQQGTIYALKGKEPSEEIDLLPATWKAQVTGLNVPYLQAERCVVSLTREN